MQEVIKLYVNVHQNNYLNVLLKNQDYLKKIDFNINKNMKELNLDQTNYDKRKSNFETQMKEEEKRIQNLIKQKQKIEKNDFFLLIYNL